MVRDHGRERKLTVVKSSEAIMAVLETVRGKRPYSLNDEETEQVFNITLALVVELASTNDRLDQLERQFAASTGSPLSEIKAGNLTAAEVEAEREEALEAYLLRTLRILIDPRATMDGRPKARHMATRSLA